MGAEWHTSRPKSVCAPMARAVLWGICRWERGNDVCLSTYWHLRRARDAQVLLGENSAGNVVDDERTWTMYPFGDVSFDENTHDLDGIRKEIQVQTVVCVDVMRLVVLVVFLAMFW